MMGIPVAFRNGQFAPSVYAGMTLMALMAAGLTGCAPSLSYDIDLRAARSGDRKSVV